MSYFQQIDELLNPNQKSSDILSPQQPGQGQNQQQQGAQQQQGSASTAITGAGPGAPSSSSSGASSNKAVQGQSPSQYTQVGYNPKAYSEQNAGNQTDLNLSKDVVSGAAKATEDLKQKSADFAANQPKVPQVSDEDINKAISGDKDAYTKVQGGLNPSPLTPEQKAPDFSSLSAPQILTSGDAISAQLQRAAGTGDYNRGMADFDRALYQKSDAYKADVGRGQTAVTNFNQALQDEIDKWKGTDRGAELQAVQQQLQYKLGQQAQGIQAGVNAKLPGAQQSLNDQYDKLGDAAKGEFQGAVGKKGDEIDSRLKYLEGFQKDNPGIKYNQTFNRELQGLIDAKDKLKNLDPTKYGLNPGVKPSIDSSFVTTQADADKFQKIMDLLKQGGSLQTSKNPNGENPKLDDKSLKNYLDNLIQVGNDDYKWTLKSHDNNLNEDVRDAATANTNSEVDNNAAFVQGALNPTYIPDSLKIFRNNEMGRKTADEAAAKKAAEEAQIAMQKAEQSKQAQAVKAAEDAANNKAQQEKSYAEQKANDAKDWAQRQANNAGNAVNNVRKKLHF